MPLTLGPGAIAVTTAIGTSMNFTIPNVIGAFAAALANALIVWLCFRYADRITEILGPSGSDAIGRIFSFILVCLGVQIFGRVSQIVADSGIVRAKINRT